LERKKVSKGRRRRRRRRRRRSFQSEKLMSRHT
jgi:hypothetical protein